MTIKELKKLLGQYPADTQVVRMDWFGRPVPFDKYCFTFHDYKKGDNPQGVLGPHLDVVSPDIGEPPD